MVGYCLRYLLLALFRFVTETQLELDLNWLHGAQELGLAEMGENTHLKIAKESKLKQQ